MSQRALSPQQFPLEGLHPSLSGSEVPDVIRGRVARHVFAQANVRQTGRNPDADKPYQDPLVAAPHLMVEPAGGAYGHYGYRPEHEELWTSQAHLHMPTLIQYAKGNIPDSEGRTGFRYNVDPEGYRPETYVHGGKRWLAEGHHRTVATRLGR